MKLSFHGDHFLTHPALLREIPTIPLLHNKYFSVKLLLPPPSLPHYRHITTATSCASPSQKEIKVGVADARDVYHSLQVLCGEGKIERAVSLLTEVQKPLSSHGYLSILKVCNKSDHSFVLTKKIYDHMAQNKATLTPLLGDYLAMTLARCGAMEEAFQVFETLTFPTVFSWTAMISVCISQGHPEKALALYRSMESLGVEPNSYTFVSLFKACGSLFDLKQGKRLHFEARRRGLDSHVFVGSTLVSMYGKCDAIREAEDVFANLPRRDSISWNAMLTAYVEQGQGKKAMLLYRQMHAEGVAVNRNTLVFALQACALLVEKVVSSINHDTSNDALQTSGSHVKKISIPQEIGWALHAEVSKRGLLSDIMLVSALVSMYGKCGTIPEAENVFASSSARDTVSWNAMIASYVEQGEDMKALFLYKLMHEEGIHPDQPTFVATIRACGNVAEKEESYPAICLELGHALRTDSERLGFSLDMQVCNTFVSMYGKCGGIIEAEEVFGSLSCPDVVSWTGLLCTYVEQGYGEKAIEMYREMKARDVADDDVAILATLQACGATGSLEICIHLHFQIVSAGYDSATPIVSALLIAYRSCGTMPDALSFFNGLSHTNIVFWNACIAGHAAEGNYIASLSMFENMKASSVEPDDLTFISALSACRHNGLVSVSLEYFESMMRDYGLIPSTKHYGILLDLLGRAGEFDKIQNIMEKSCLHMDVCIWLCLLGACGTHGKLDLAKRAFDHAVNLDPKHGGAYVLLSNAYADAGLQACIDEVGRLRELQGVFCCEWD